MEIKCYGCNETKPLGLRMKVEYKKQKQPFCKECSNRLAKIKFGLI